MGKSFLLARSNLRRAKGQTVAIVALILLAAMLLNLWLMLAFDYKANFERDHARLNAEHATFVFGSRSDELRSFLDETAQNDARTAEYRTDDVLWMKSTIDYNGGSLTSDFIVMRTDVAIARTVGRYEIVEEGADKNGVYLPVLFGAGGDHAVGSEITFAVGGDTVVYPVSGFYNNMMTGSFNCVVCALLLPAERYADLEASGLTQRSVMLSSRIKDKAQSEDYAASVRNAVSARFPSVAAVSNDYALIEQSRYVTQMICSAIVSVAALLISVIALVVIASNIINYIQENMKNLGALKAMGYTSRQLVGALLLQFLGVALIASLVGVGLSYCLFPSLNTMLITQTGIPYAVHFLPAPMLAALAVIGVTIALIVWLSSLRMKKIEPIVALRQGIRTHNFRRNRIPLSASRLPLNLALSCKTALSNVRQNVTVFVTMLVVSLVLVFSGLIFENVIVDMTPMVDLIVGENADATVNVAAETENDFLAAMAADPRVEKTYLFYDAGVQHVGGLSLYASVIDDPAKLNNQNLCYAGRLPKFDNEMSVGGKYAEEQDLKIGDEITLSAEGREANFIISGFTQLTNYFGKDCMLLRSGYERMGELPDASYYLNIADGTDIDTFLAEVSKTCEGIRFTVDLKSVLDGTAGVYVSVMSVIVVAIFSLSAIVIAFVLYLLVRTLLNRKKQDYGVLKSLGFTTGQLVLQTAASFMPVMIVSALVGLIVSAFVINPLTAVFLGGIGIRKCAFAIPVGFIAVAGLGMMLFAFAFSCLLSLRIRKIAPRELLTNE